MGDYHINTRGWKDIGHHLALMPDGLWVTGRPFDQMPASIKGWNTGALAVEMVGNFDKPGTGASNSSGYDKLEGKQRNSVLALIQYYGQRFGYDGVKFHREDPGVTKTCSGTSLTKSEMIKEAKPTGADTGGSKEHKGKKETGVKSMVALKRGDKGEEVKRLQQDLIILGYGEPMKDYGADGSFGSATEAAVRVFQKDKGLEVDGRAGPKTRGKIEELIQQKVDELLTSPAGLDYKIKFEEVNAKLNGIKKIIG